MLDGFLSLLARLILSAAIHLSTDFVNYLWARGLRVLRLFDQFSFLCEGFVPACVLPILQPHRDRVRFGEEGMSSRSQIPV